MKNPSQIHLSHERKSPPSQALLPFLVGLIANSVGCGQAPVATPTPGTVTPPAVRETLPTSASQIGEQLDPGNFPILEQDALIQGQRSGADVWTFPQTVRSDSLLKVRIIPQPAQTMNLPGAGWTPSGMPINVTDAKAYGCIQLTINLVSPRSKSFTTPVLAVPGTYSSLCAGAPQAYVADFSRFIPADGSPVEITLSNPRYDAWCLIRMATYDFYLPQFGQQGAEYMANEAAGLYAQSCPTKAVLAPDSIRAKVQVQVNGTDRVR